MQYAKVGNSNILASKIILGTWQAGKDMWSGIDDKETTKAIRGSLDLGINFIDTAAVYGSGHSEQVIGSALKEVSRDKYYLATKVFANHLTFADVIKECDKSLKNLATDYIDLYQVHWPSGAFDSDIVPIKETMDALNTLKEQGKILNIGVSNFSRDQIAEAREYGEIISNQPPYSLIWRQYDIDTNPYCRDNNIAILSYSPLAQGILTGKFKKNHKFMPGDHRSSNKFMQPEIFTQVEIVLASLQPYADKYCTSIGNIALNWLISQPNTFAITGARNLAQITDNAKCCDFNLDDAEIAAIDRISKNVTDHMEQVDKMWG